MKLDARQRHQLMARFTSMDTGSELALRRALRLQGTLGYRLHLRELPGRPDVAFTRWKVAVFVDGEFWHGHPSAFVFGAKGPYWDQKILRNQARDESTNKKLVDLGWIVVRIWDRDVHRDPDAAASRVGAALTAAGRPMTRPTAASEECRTS
jgi:DNA mismatch endonuclease (patch repair protein)